MRIGSYGYAAENLKSSQKTGWTIYHNPRCSKSNEALDLLRQRQMDPSIVYFLETPLTVRELEQIVALLKVEAKEIVRTQEPVFSTLSLDLSNHDQVIAAIIAHPELLQRPIVLHAGRAVIGRPPERVLELIG